MPKNSAVAMITVAGVIALGLTGCSASVNVGTTSTPSVSASTLQDELAAKLTDSGRPTDSVVCKDDLPGEVGKSANCDVVYADGTKANAVLTTKSVEGDTVNFDYDVTVLMDSQQVQDVLGEKLAAQTGLEIESVECSADLPAKVGGSVDCFAASTDGQSQGYTVTVTSVENGTVNFDFQPTS